MRSLAIHPRGRATIAAAAFALALAALAPAALGFCTTPALAAPAELTPPSVPGTVGRDSAFTVTGDLRPAHAVEAPVTVHCFRLQAEEWVDLASFTGAAVAADGEPSPYACRVALPSAGVWRLRAVHEDAEHGVSWSDWSADVSVTAGKDQPIWNADGVSTLPERMASRLNALQLVVVTGPRLGARNGTLRLFDYQDGDWVQRLGAAAQFGGRGLADGLKRHAGSRTTPTGIWRMARFAFGRHAAAPSGCGLAWRRITPRSWWCAARGPAYNTWAQTSRWVEGEHLADYRQSYEFAVHTGYNALPNQRVFGRGTAIFIHVDHAGYSAGCITLARRDVVALLRLLKGGRRLACAVGTTRSGGATAITAY